MLWDTIVEEAVDEGKDQMVLAAIFQAVLEDMLLLLAEETTKEAWDTLKTIDAPRG